MTSRLDAIRQREQAAWPGDWHDNPTDDPAPFFVLAGPGSYVVADVFRGEDAAFIAHARADIPALLAVVEAAAAVMDNHDAQRYLNSTNFDLFAERGGFPKSDELRLQEMERKEALRAALAPLLEPEP